MSASLSICHFTENFSNSDPNNIELKNGSLSLDNALKNIINNYNLITRNIPCKIFIDHSSANCRAEYFILIEVKLDLHKEINVSENFVHLLFCHLDIRVNVNCPEGCLKVSFFLV